MMPVDNHMQTREAEKAEALARIAEVLDELENQRREPDRWERDCLVHAFAAFFSGIYLLAATEARLALVPPNQHASDASLPSDPIFDRCNQLFLRRVFQAAQTWPTRPFPYFGPVELRGDLSN